MAHKLGKPYQEILRLANSGQLPATFVDDRRVFHKQIIDDMAARKPAPRTEANEGDYYYTPVQAAEMLGTNVYELNKMIHKGMLPAVSIDKHRWLPAKAVEDQVRRKYGPRKLARTPEPHRVRHPEKQKPEKVMGKDNRATRKRTAGEPDPKTERSVGSEVHYTIDEVSKKLGRPHHEVWRMAFSGKLRVETVGDQRMFLKRSVDDLLRNKKGEIESVDQSAPAREASSVPLETTAERDKKEHRRAVEAAQMLGISMNRAKEMVAAGQLIVDHTSGRLVSPNQPLEDLRIEETKKTKKHFTTEEAARYLGEPVAETIRRVRNKELPLRKGRIPARSLLNLYYDLKLKRKKATGPLEEAQGPNPVTGAEDPSHKRLEDRADHSSESVPDGLPKSREADTGTSDEIEELRNELKTLQQRLRTEKAHWEHELQREREGRKQDNLDAQYEIAQIDAQIENQRRDAEALRVTLEEERSEKAEIERRAEELQTELDEERELRLTTEESLGPTGLDWHERDEYEERLAALSYDLEQERKKRSGKEEWTSGLQSRLEESEVEKQRLEEALSSEKEKTRRLETDKRLLNEVRRLLGAAETRELLEPDKGTTSESVTEDDADETSGELFLKTPFGQVSFLPPFPLDEQDEELLRLIAREDELTAEQIRTLTGRRRAAYDFEHLLDSLADEGLKDLVIEVSEDRYRFNPAALQNDQRQ